MRCSVLTADGLAGGGAKAEQVGEGPRTVEEVTVKLFGFLDGRVLYPDGYDVVSPGPLSLEHRTG